MRRGSTEIKEALPQIQLRKIENRELEVSFPTKQMRDEFIKLIGHPQISPEQKKISPAVKDETLSPYLKDGKDNVLYFPAFLETFWDHTSRTSQSRFIVVLANQDQQQKFAKILDLSKGEPLLKQHYPTIELQALANERGITELFLPIPPVLSSKKVEVEVKEPSSVPFLAASSAETNKFFGQAPKKLPDISADLISQIVVAKIYLANFRMTRQTTAQECDYFTEVLHHLREFMHEEISKPATLQLLAVAATRSRKAAELVCSSSLCHLMELNDVLNIYFTYQPQPQSEQLLKDLRRQRPDIETVLADVENAQSPIVAVEEEPIQIEEIECPISLEIMTNPVKIILDGSIFYCDQSSLDAHFEDAKKKLELKQTDGKAWDGTAPHPAAHDKVITRAMVQDASKEIFKKIEKYREQQALKLTTRKAM